MRQRILIPTLILLLPAAWSAAGEEIRLPWREAGLTETQAAAHLLDRLAFGARVGDVDRVVAAGLERWLAEQLRGDLPDRRVEAHLKRLKSLGMTTREITLTYRNPAMVLREARRAGVIDRGELLGAGDGDRRDRPGGDTRRQVIAYARQQGYRPQRELLGQLMAQKLYRAVFSRNQLIEVLTDFWFNHFNVSLTDSDCRLAIPTYERDAIRPHVLGSFRDMLTATARHPAMLFYLDNARSTAAEGAPVRFDHRGFRGQFGWGGSPRGTVGDAEERAFEFNRPRGLNENYARELLELHTLGVDGGFTQDDVVAVARAFSGWTTYPTGPMREHIERRLELARRRLERFGLAGAAGFVFDEDFLFRADVHDAGPKTVLGRTMPAGRGIEDGLEVLDLLAAHPATARHLATKLARRFVADEPPESLVARLAAVWLDSGGDLRRMVVALAESPEFWDSRGQKIKSPFELAASALRVTGARLTHPRATIEWIARMGQPLYAYPAPTGYPDRAEHWINPGTLVARLSFVGEVAAGRVAGVKLETADDRRRLLASPEFQRR